ncbi:MAG: hypothetical protein SFV18_09860 [Bryobacteraceae bacterium]|nr:hypothetical protein [Bryobacteraceae bacterium]
MEFHRQLLEVALKLLNSNGNEPSAEASLRRSISTSYYALFHFLVDSSVKRFAKHEGLRDRLKRCFDHGDMKLASDAFSKSTERAKALVLGPIPQEVEFIAEAFVELQKERHFADYDASWTPENLPLKASVCAAMVKEAFRAWARIQDHPAAEAYLIALLTWNKIGKR